MDYYLPRIVDSQLNDLTAVLPAVSIEGARGVGKTETALRRATTVYRLDDPAQAEIIRSAPSKAVTGEPLILLDEWQRMPALWDLVRRAVDADPRTPRFILTGSATPTPAPTHSGAGRIVTVPMRPLSLVERGLGAPSVSLSELLTGKKPSISGQTNIKVDDYVREIVCSGFPGMRDAPRQALQPQLDGYIDRIVEHDINELGRKVRDRGGLRRWMTAYAAATSTSASFEAIRDAASAGESDKPSRTTTIPYRSALEGLWMIEEIPAWLPSHNLFHRLASAPKHQMVDPAISARLLGVSEDALLEGKGNGWGFLGTHGTLLGALFESLVALSVRVYAQACRARVMHFRTHAGEREIDLIVVRDDGRIVALEVKLSALTSDSDVVHLNWLASKLGDNLLDAAIVNTGREAYRRADGIAVIPATLLGP